jgi:mono/diheme cytochrome c family protein
MRNSVKGMMVLSMLGGTLAFGAPPAPSKEMVEKGKGSFQGNCAACHGAKGDGSGPAAQALTPRPRNFLTEPFKLGNKPAEVFKTLSSGMPNSPMIAFAHLPEEERWALTYFVLELQKPGSVLKGKGAAKKK